MSELRFPKEERLKNRKTLARLFTEGQSFGIYPIRVIWLEESKVMPAPVQFTVSVPKKKFKSAVDRNRIKRQVREAYRLHKSTFLDKLSAKHESGKSFALMMIYTSTNKEAYAKIEKSVRKTLDRLGRDLNK